MNVVVFGCKGQLGRCLQDRAKGYVEKHGFNFFFFDRAQADISNFEQVNKSIVESNANIVINAAAYTAVDKAETEVELAYAINATGPENMAKVCNKLDIPLIHVSTDYVFDGEATKPYTPESPTNPQSVYGKSKLAGELAIEDILNKHVIIRTAWVFSEYGNNFVKTMLRLGQERDELGIVADQVGCPTYAGDLANNILNVLLEITEGCENWGVFHYSSKEKMSWYDFAQTVFDTSMDLGLYGKSPIVKPITTQMFLTPAKRPNYSVMDISRFEISWKACDFDFKQSLSFVLKAL
ncbi:dTDP-4-dehydrorhamnose reductase [Thalassotalea aquiviva]|uniref:dTDP-4-dehydrorhamnose reductase n=1 Tax=Thalassotalea aquiviva TaxID=3242415 RepID=UPI00352B326B